MYQVSCAMHKMIKRNIIFLCAVFMLFKIAFAQDADGWNISKSTHFIVYYKKASEDFIQQAVNKSEDCYTMITDIMGLTRFDFWLWEERAKIYVYDTLADYVSATGQPKWSAGFAIPKEKRICTFAGPSGFFDNLLPHEMGHKRHA